MRLSIQTQKDFFRQLCKTVGHAPEKENGRCSRCQKNLRTQFVAWEMTGMVVHNYAGIAKITVE